MSRKRKGTRKATKRGPTLRRNRPLPNRPLLGLALLGMLLTGYLSANAWFGSQAAYCGSGSSCDLVQSSHWSTLFLLPIAFWGFATYALLAVISLRVKRTVQHWTYGWIVTLVGLGVSLYLTWVSVFVLEAACLYCLASLALMLVSFAVVTSQQPEGIPGFRWPGWLAQTGGLAALVVVLLHLHFSGVFAASAGPEDPYLRALATHLDEVGAKFYGASWCPHCREQKNLFGPSAKRLPYVECSPTGRGGPSARECVVAEVEDYPTWVIVGKRYVRVLPADTLARYSGFEWSPPGRGSSASGPGSDGE